MTDVVRALEPLVDLCEKLGLRVQIGGSVATSAYGVARTTLHVDVVLDLPAGLVDRFVDALEADYMIEREAVMEAVRQRATFNLIHQATVIKIDVFVPAAEGFSRESFLREVRDTLEVAPGAREFSLATPEDMILHKLVWFELGNRVSERLWSDVAGVVSVLGASLDWDYVERWAASLGVEDLARQLRSQHIGKG